MENNIKQINFPKEVNEYLEKLCENRAGGHQWNWDNKKNRWVCLRCKAEKPN